MNQQCHDKVNNGLNLGNTVHTTSLPANILNLKIKIYRNTILCAAVIRVLNFVSHHGRKCTTYLIMVHLMTMLAQNG
jgi:hypothetical protein